MQGDISRFDPSPSHALKKADLLRDHYKQDISVLKHHRTSAEKELFCTWQCTLAQLDRFSVTVCQARTEGIQVAATPFPQATSCQRLRHAPMDQAGDGTHAARKSDTRIGSFTAFQAMRKSPRPPHLR